MLRADKNRNSEKRGDTCYIYACTHSGSIQSLERGYKEMASKNRGSKLNDRNNRMDVSGIGMEVDGSTKTSKRGNKDENLNIRLNAAEKKRLEKEAEYHGIKVSEYARKLMIDDKDSLRKENSRIMSKLTRSITLMQDMVNIIEEKYAAEDDLQLAEGMEELWEILS